MTLDSLPAPAGFEIVRAGDVTLIRHATLADPGAAVGPAALVGFLGFVALLLPLGCLLPERWFGATLGLGVVGGGLVALWGLRRATRAFTVITVDSNGITLGEGAGADHAPWQRVMLIREQRAYASTHEDEPGVPASVSVDLVREPFSREGRTLRLGLGWSDADRAWLHRLLTEAWETVRARSEG